MKPSLLIVGLGNPGSSYDGTRHNAGFAAVDFLGDTFGTSQWIDKPKFGGFIQEASWEGVSVLLLKPSSFMNLSGHPIRKTVDFFKLDAASRVIVCCDDIDIPLGTLRLRQKGGPGTHNGLKSVIEQCGEDIPRLRIGIGPKPEGADLAAWVLSRMSQEESVILQDTIKTIPSVIQSFILDGSKD